MNKKYFFKGTDVQVKHGDKITISNLSKEDLVMLTKAGILQERNTIELGDVLKKLGSGIGLNLSEMIDFIDSLENINPVPLFQMLLKEIAIMLDKQYEGHITDSEELWAISMYDGKPMELAKEYINSNTMSLFRSKEDAQYACNILEYYWNIIWGDE